MRSQMKTNMAEEEKSPLLEGLESTDVNYKGPRETVRDLYRRGNRLGVNGQFSVDSDRSINISSSNSVQNLAEVDHIVAIFVVAFDTRSGNLVEWCLPEDADLDGIEFKAMTSGSHTLKKDFVYFKKDSFYGLACFENMPVESEIERGARMKSVGILSTSYTLLYRHMQFLETQVRHQLEVPGKYSQLKAFYDDKKGMLPSSISIDSIRFASPASTPSSEILPELKLISEQDIQWMSIWKVGFALQNIATDWKNFHNFIKITHPAGCFSQFMKFFGENVFTLWKYVLLQKRILFFSPPPIGVVCYRVYCACSLGNHGMPEMMSGREPKPFFYVNVADIETLESEMSYIACTTEKIFESKTHLYDVYVDNQNLTATTPALKELLKPSDADKDKSAKLNNQRSAHLFSMEELGEENVMDEEELFTSYFTELNNRLFQTLLDVAGSQDRQLTSDHMRNMGLDPIGDRPFLMELVETYGIDVMLMVDNPCCPR